jgi:RNA polymerase sigma-70 factor, ECF subfamily
VRKDLADSADRSTPDALYEEAIELHGAALARLARAYEADPDKRRDLLQEIHFALWRSFAQFGGRCSLRTWIYRVGHNAAVSHVLQQRRRGAPLVGLEEIEAMADPAEKRAAERRSALEDLTALIRRLKPMDRQIVLCYLEGLDAAGTGEVTGLSAAAVAMKIHRIKSILARMAGKGGRDGE